MIEEENDIEDFYAIAFKYGFLKDLNKEEVEKLRKRLLILSVSGRNKEKSSLVSK
jgi:hypothetical protein